MTTFEIRRCIINVFRERNGGPPFEILNKTAIDLTALAARRTEGTSPESAASMDPPLGKDSTRVPRGSGSEGSDFGSDSDSDSDSDLDLENEDLNSDSDSDSDSGSGSDSDLDLENEDSEIGFGMGHSEPEPDVNDSRGTMIVWGSSEWDVDHDRVVRERGRK
jgi:hypothetical protein